jgi:hypothetical protein
MQMKFTERAVADADCPEGKKVLLVWADNLHGFGLRVTATGSKAWIVQRTLAGGVDRRVTLGR